MACQQIGDLVNNSWIVSTFQVEKSCVFISVSNLWVLFSFQTQFDHTHDELNLHPITGSAEVVSSALKKVALMSSIFLIENLRLSTLSFGVSSSIMREKWAPKRVARDSPTLPPCVVIFFVTSPTIPGLSIPTTFTIKLVVDERVRTEEV